MVSPTIFSPDGHRNLHVESSFVVEEEHFQLH